MVNEEKEATQKPDSGEEKTSQNPDGEKTPDKSSQGQDKDVDGIHPNRFKHEKKKREEAEKKLKELKSEVNKLKKGSGEDIDEDENITSSDDDLISRVEEVKKLQDFSSDELKTLKKFKKAGNYSSYSEAADDEDFQTLIKAKRKKEESNKSPKPTTGNISQENISDIDGKQLGNMSDAQKDKYFKEIGLFD